jgi:signal transduction histidine kinase
MRENAVADPAAGSSQHFPLVIAAMPINERNTRIALGVIILLLSVIVIVAPFADAPLAQVDAFIPVLQTVMCVVDLITAALLFAQYSIYPKRALLALASGYVFAGLFAFLQTLAFPGAYSATGLIGDGVDSAAWLFVLWHTTFLLGVIVYALSKDADVAATPAGESTTVIIAITIACVLAGTVGLTWIVTESAGYLPRLYLGVLRQTPFASGLDAFLLLLSIVGFVLLFVHRRTILDLWLIVILLAWSPNFVVAIFLPIVRFSFGWYAARCFSLVASSMLLFVLLAETWGLYRRLANANLRLQRERTDRLMSVQAATAAMAHEIKQPLTAISASGAAGLSWLKRIPPDLDEIRACFVSVVDASKRAGEAINSTLGLFKRTADQRTMVQLDEVARQVLSLVQHDLQVNGISVTTEYQENLPQIQADHAASASDFEFDQERHRGHGLKLLWRTAAAAGDRLRQFSCFTLHPRLWTWNNYRESRPHI